MGILREDEKGRLSVTSYCNSHKTRHLVMKYESAFASKISYLIVSSHYKRIAVATDLCGSKEELLNAGISI
jgi:hypothetical protein